MSSQNITEGNASNSIDRFDPMRLIKYPNDREPNNAPMQFTEPIQDNSSLVSGPEMSGVSSDCNLGVTGEIQPERFRKLAIISCVKLKKFFYPLYTRDRAWLHWLLEK